MAKRVLVKILAAIAIAVLIGLSLINKLFIHAAPGPYSLDTLFSADNVLGTVIRLMVAAGLVWLGYVLFSRFRKNVVDNERRKDQAGSRDKDAG